MISPLRDQAEAETQAALEGVLTTLGGPPLSAELAVVPLRVYGDAVRLGLDAPGPLRAWASGCSPVLLDEALVAALELLDGRLPPANTPDAHLDPTMGTRLRERDHVESVILAVRRVWLPRPMSQLASHARLLGRVAEVDKAFGSVVTREQAILLLGVRAGLGATWTSSFPDATRGEEGATDDAQLDPLRGLPPSPETVARYVESGVMRKLVEGVAVANADFADELAETIDAMRARGHAGFLARRWQHEHAKGPAAEQAWTFSAPPLAYAASSGDDDRSSSRPERLGKLFDGDIEATLVVGAREVAIELVFEPGEVAFAQLGEETRSLPSTESSCRIVVRRTEQPIVLTVRTRTGEQITQALSLVTSGS